MRRLTRRFEVAHDMLHSRTHYYIDGMYSIQSLLVVAYSYAKHIDGDVARYKRRAMSCPCSFPRCLNGRYLDETWGFVVDKR